MKKKTHEQQLTEAIQRLLRFNGRDDVLMPRDLFIADLRLVLDELESLRLALVEQRQALIEAP